MCVVSGIPHLSGCREYTHRRDQLLLHIKTVHKITYPGKAGQYEYEFDNHKQTTLPFAKKSRLDDSESMIITDPNMTNDVVVEVKGDAKASNDLNLKSQHEILQPADISEVGPNTNLFSNYFESICLVL